VFYVDTLERTINFPSQVMSFVSVDGIFSDISHINLFNFKSISLGGLTSVSCLSIWS
jgi:hypothetical protein